MPPFPCLNSTVSVVFDASTDAYADPRFDRSVDLQSGYHTRSVLCVPVKSYGTVVGVIQLINKTEGAFTDDDVTLAKLMAAQVLDADVNSRARW